MATTDQSRKRKGSGRPKNAGRALGRGGQATPDTARRTDSPDTAESLTEAISLLESFVSSFEPGRYSGDDAAVLVDRFSRGEHLCATGKALAAKRAAAVELYRRDGARTPAEWLAKKTGDSVGNAAGSLQLADQMEHHRGLSDALRKGELSPSRARQVADVLSLDPKSGDELVEAAKDKNESNRQLADRCLRAKAKARSTEDTRAAYERIRRSRYLRHYTDRDGAFRLEGLLTPDSGAKVLAALKPTRTVIFDEARRHGVKERPEAYEADALVALLTGERQSPATGAQAGTDRAGSDRAGSDRANTDEAGTDRIATTPRESRFPPPASVHLRVDLAALRRGSLDHDECCEIPGVGPVPLETARSLLGDAILHLVITKGNDIATICSLGRTIRAPLETALVARDPTCVVPGCDVRDGLEIDHRIIPVVENGETALWNLARLCHHHHYLRHHKGFRLEGGPGAWQWLPPEKPPPRGTERTDSDEDTDRLFQLE